MTQQQKKPVEAPEGSLIERAIRAFESGALARPVNPANPADVAANMARPADILMPQAQAAQPAPVAAAPAVAQPAPVQAAVAQPAPVAYAPDPAPVAQPVEVQRFAPVPAPEAAPAPFYKGRAYRIDRHRLRQAGLISPDDGVTGQLEEFRIVKRQLLQHADDMRRRGGGGAAQRVLVTSALPNEGKSFSSANLALSIAAERDNDVLLVDFDNAKNSVLGWLGIPNGPGLMDALADPAIDVRDCVITTDMPGLTVLPGGRTTLSDNEYVASDRAAQVLDLLTEGAPRRLVIIDSPPTLAASLPVEVAKLVGQVVFVVRADQTAQGSIEDAVQLLAGCPNVQLLLNATQYSPSGRRYGSYYK